MSLSTSADRVTEDVNPTAPAVEHQSEKDNCTMCGLRRSEHGVQLIHRFIPSGQPIVMP